MPAISDRRPVLNRRHWLAKNLVALWVPISGGRVLANLVTPGQGESHLTRANNAYHRNDGLIAWDNTSGSGYSYTGGYLPTSAQIPCPLTFAWFGDVIAERNGDYQRIFGLEEIGLAHSLEFQRHDSNGEVNFHYEDGSFNGPEVTVTASGFLQGRRRSLIGVLGGTVAACATYLNGTLGGTGTTVGVQNWTGGDAIVIGPIDGLQTGCTNTGFRAGFLCNRPISSVEAAKLHANPEEMWVQPWRQPRFIAVGSVGTSATVTPTEAVLVLAVPAPTITATGVPTPTEAALVLAVPAPTITATATITPTEAVLILDVPAPTITATGTITPTEAVLVLAVDAPTITATGTVTPTEAVLVLDVPAPTVTIGTIVQPTECACVLDVPAPTITFDTAITPTEAVLTLAVPAPTITSTGDATPTPTEAVLTLAVPAPTITTTADATATPTEAVLILDVPAPTVSVPATAAPTEAVLVLAVPAPTITATGTVTPTEVVLILLVPAPTVVGQLNAIATPTEVVLILAIPAPTITAIFIAGITFTCPWLGPRWQAIRVLPRWTTTRQQLEQRWSSKMEGPRWAVRPPKKGA